MAVKKILADGYTYEDLFDTQEALDSGILGSVQIGTTSKTSYDKGFLGFGAGRADDPKNTSTTPWMAGAGDFASNLGKTDAVAANKKRKAEVKGTKAAGFGSNNSILGGAGF